MNKTKILLMATLVAGIAASPAMGSLIRITNDNPGQGFTALDASGATLTSHGANTWTFWTGSFSAGFSASMANVDQWEANFRRNDTLTATWAVSGPNANRAQAQGGVTDNSWAGQQAVIWGFNSLDIASTSQWIALTNDAWVFPTETPLELAPRPENIWNFSSDGTTIVGGVGSWSADGMQMQVIPEPSTYALIFGLGILGFLGYRRVRK